MKITSEEKIKKLQVEILAARSQKQKCNLLVDLAMELRYSNPVMSLQEAKKALSISEEINFAPGKGRSFFCMGLVYFHLSEYEKAFVFLDRAYRIFLEAGDLWGRSNALNNIGLIYLRLGDYEKALENFYSSLEIKKESDDQFGTANVMISMATIHRETGNLSEAQVLLAESLKISEELEFDVLTSKALLELGINLEMEDKFSAAEEKFYESMKLFEKQNNPSGIAQCLQHLGKINSASGDSNQAVSLFEQGQTIAAETGDKSLVTIFLSNIADEKLKSGNPIEAIALLQQAKKIALKTQEKPMLSVISQLLSTGYEAIKNIKDALSEYKNFIELKNEINSVEATTRLRNQQISAKVDALIKENKMLEAEKMAAINQVTTLLKTQEIKSLNDMMEGQEKERKRIASDLHDRIGSSLSAIKLHLIGFSKIKGAMAPSHSELGKITLMLDEVVDEVRRVSHDLDSGVLMKFGITSVLRDLCQSIEGAGDLKVNFYSAGCDERLDHRTEIALYRITQELISNVLRHAQAKEVNIHLNGHPGHISLMVEDDGAGFDPERATDGIGIQNIRTRVTEMNGKLFFDSLPGKGCTVSVEIPIPTKS